jgi:hypothetical protein
MQTAAHKAFILVAVGLVAACRPDSLSGPTTALPVAPPLADFYAYDPCVYDVTFSCHGSPVLYEYFSDATMPYGDPSYDCPNGCTTYPVTTGTKAKVNNVLDYHIKPDTSCSWVKSFIRQSMVYNRTRWYSGFDGNYGDAHWSSTSPISNDIHIWSGTFADSVELGKTLIHEAAHINFDNSNDLFAESWANQCYKP